MAVKAGDLVQGSAVLILLEKRHVYTFEDPFDGTRGCQFCDLKHEKVDGHWPEEDAKNDPEQPCPGR